MSKFILLFITLASQPAVAASVTAPGGWGISFSICELIPSWCPAQQPPASCDQLRADITRAEDHLCNMDRLAETCGEERLFPAVSNTVPGGSGACDRILSERATAFNTWGDALIAASRASCDLTGMERPQCER